MLITLWPQSEHLVMAASSRITCHKAQIISNWFLKIQTSDQSEQSPELNLMLGSHQMQSTGHWLVYPWDVFLLMLIFHYGRYDWGKFAYLIIRLYLCILIDFVCSLLAQKLNYVFAAQQCIHTCLFVSSDSTSSSFPLLVQIFWSCVYTAIAYWCAPNKLRPSWRRGLGQLPNKFACSIKVWL